VQTHARLHVKPKAMHVCITKITNRMKLHAKDKLDRMQTSEQTVQGD